MLVRLDLVPAPSSVPLLTPGPCSRPSPSSLSFALDTTSRPSPTSSSRVPTSRHVVLWSVRVVRNVSSPASGHASRSPPPGPAATSHVSLPSADPSRESTTVGAHVHALTSRSVDVVVVPARPPVAKVDVGPGGRVGPVLPRLAPRPPRLPSEPLAAHVPSYARPARLPGREVARVADGGLVHWPVAALYRTDAKGEEDVDPKGGQDLPVLRLRTVQHDIHKIRASRQARQVRPRPHREGPQQQWETKHEQGRCGGSHTVWFLKADDPFLCSLPYPLFRFSLVQEAHW